jgi:hypothetical protein
MVDLSNFGEFLIDRHELGLEKLPDVLQTLLAHKQKKKIPVIDNGHFLTETDATFLH